MLALTSIALGASAIGCVDQQIFGPSYLPRATAAKAISDPLAHDDALRTVALRAIQDGDAVVANEAVDAFHDDQIRDDVAARCARWLGEHWRAGEATVLAKKIGDVILRDRVLKQIATGKA